MILKKKSVPAYVKLQGDKDYKNNINIDGSFLFRRLEVLRADVINSIIESMFSKLVEFADFIKYTDSIKGIIQRFLNFLQQNDLMLFDKVSGTFYF